MRFHEADHAVTSTNPKYKSNNATYDVLAYAWRHSPRGPPPSLLLPFETSLKKMMLHPQITQHVLHFSLRHELKQESMRKRHACRSQHHNIAPLRIPIIDRHKHRSLTNHATQTKHDATCKAQRASATPPTPSRNAKNHAIFPHSTACAHSPLSP